VPTGQGVTLTAGSPGGIIAGAVSGPFSPVKPFAYDAPTGALYGLSADSQMQSGPELIGGRWVLSSDGAHAWLLP
jgi:hypothetical protein